MFQTQFFGRQLLCRGQKGLLAYGRLWRQGPVNEVAPPWMAAPPGTPRTFPANGCENGRSKQTKFNNEFAHHSGVEVNL
jgi:hypothetical protein